MVGFVAVVAVAVVSQITDVTVYNDRAEVVRTAEVTLEQGVNKLRFEGLPEGIDSRGIQVDGFGSATVLDVRFKSENFKEIPKQAWKDLYERQDDLLEDGKSIQKKIERFNEAKTFLKKISVKVTHPAEKEGEVPLNPDSWSQMLGLYNEKNAEYDDGLRVAELELKGMHEALKKVQADIRDAGADTRKKRHLIEVDLEADQAGVVKLTISYMVGGPQWMPTYDIRVNTETRAMEVHYFALIRQNTGENWGDVSLKLSTANPALGGQHSELDPWRIEMYSLGVRKKMWSRSSADDLYGSDVELMVNQFGGGDNEYGAPLAAMSEAEGAMPEPIQVRNSVATRQGAAVIFTIKGDSSIDSDNVEHRVSVSRLKLPSTFRYSTVPKVDPQVYLKAKAVNQGSHPFLEGEANIFLDGHFLANSLMERVAPEEEFWVFLGADESMKVEHKLIRRYQSKEGLRGRGTRHTFEYLMTVENTHAIAEEVLVWDQLPISGNEDLKVKLLQPKYSKDTEALKLDDEQRIQWFQTVGSGQEWKIPFSFYVEAPKDMRIDGLE